MSKLHFLFAERQAMDGVVIDQTYRLVCDDTPDSCAWEETETKLKQPRSTGLVFPIPNSLAKDLCD